MTEVHFGLGAHSAKLSDQELMNQLKVRLNDKPVPVSMGCKLTDADALGCHSHVQRQSGLHQVLHPLPIPPHLPPSTVPYFLLYRHEHRRIILDLGLYHRFPHLRPGCQVLGPDGEGLLFQL